MPTKNKPSNRDVEFWKNELPVASRVSYGSWGRGTVVKTLTKQTINKKDRYFSIVVKLDCNRWALSDRGLATTPESVRKLLPNATIRFGRFDPAKGRTKPNDNLFNGDIIEFGGKKYMIKGSVFDGKIYKTYIVPDTDSHWCDTSFDNGIWLDKGDTTIGNSDIKLIKLHDPYAGREHLQPDSIDELLRDIKSEAKHFEDRKTIVNLFNEAIDSF